MNTCIEIYIKLFVIFACLIITSFSAKALNVKQIDTASGIKVWLVEDHKNPIVTLKFSFSGGTNQDPVKKNGLVYLLSGLLDEGAGELTSKEFQKKLNENSISMSFNASRDHFDGSMVTLTETLDTALDLLALAINNPRFDPEPVSRVKDQIIASIRSVKEKPNGLIGRVWWKGAFGTHPYGFPKKGTEISIGRITHADLQKVRKDLFAKDNLIVGVVGNISEDQLKLAIDRVFGSLNDRSNLKKISNASFQIMGKQ